MFLIYGVRRWNAHVIFHLRLLPLLRLCLGVRVWEEFVSMEKICRKIMKAKSRVLDLGMELCFLENVEVQLKCVVSVAVEGMALIIQVSMRQGSPSKSAFPILTRQYRVYQ